MYACVLGWKLSSDSLEEQQVLSYVSNWLNAILKVVRLDTESSSSLICDSQGLMVRNVCGLQVELFYITPTESFHYSRNRLRQIKRI